MNAQSPHQATIERVFDTTYHQQPARVRIGWQSHTQSYYLMVTLPNHPRRTCLFDSQAAKPPYPSIEPLLDILERQLKLHVPNHLLCEIVQQSQAMKQALINVH